MSIEYFKKELRNIYFSNTIWQDENFSERKQALETIDILNRESSRYSCNPTYKLLQKKAYSIKNRIKEINQKVSTKYKNFFSNYPTNLIREELNLLTSYNKTNLYHNHYTHENIDFLFNTFIDKNIEKVYLPKRLKDYVHLEITPLSVVLNILDQYNFNGNDVLYDLGSGLGHVLMLFGIMLDIKLYGVEIEKDYCNLSRRAFNNLGLKKINIINQAAEEIDFSNGSIFFMFTPFIGNIFAIVFEKLYALSKMKQLTIFSYGSNTKKIANLKWLKIKADEMIEPYRAAIFFSYF